MDYLRNIFSRQNLPKLLLLAAVYLLGRMEGEGRFSWGEVFGTAWNGASRVAGAAVESARGVVGF